jgi:hypothetical protein
VFLLYLFALVIGGGLLVFSLVGHDGDAHGHDAHGHDALKFLSIRTLTYFLFAFGGVGAILAKSWHRTTAPLVFLAAAAAGLLVGAAAHYAFAYLRRTDSGGREAGDEGFIGLTGRVTVPIGSGSMGKVLVERAGRTIELIARPLETAGSPPAKWKSVIVVEMTKGTAVVAPLDDPAVKEIANLGQ